jgi:hypothetical protein
MPFNYFSVLSGADKEMTHSAMIRFLLLLDPFFAQTLFPRFLHTVDPTRVYLEKTYPGRNRIDIEAWSANDDAILVIENKFKSFPTSRQLRCYEELYTRMAKEKDSPFKGRERVYYLLCFDADGVPFARNRETRSEDTGTVWNVLTYREVQEAVELFLAEKKTGHGLDERLFCEHYSRYLADYYHGYDNVCADYRNAFTGFREAGNPIAAEDNFRQALVLSRLGNAIAERAERRKLDFLIKPFDGSTSVPFLDITPSRWNSGVSMPQTYIQVQGAQIKLRIGELAGRKGKQKADAQIVTALTRRLRQKIVDGGKAYAQENMEKKIQRGVSSLTVYAEQLPLGSECLSVAELEQHIWSFYERMDSRVIAAQSKGE